MVEVYRHVLLLIEIRQFVEYCYGQLSSVHNRV